jgi:hypothetical protein
MKFASVIPLDYGFHTEEAVTIFDTEWSNLLHVLQTPQDYIYQACQSYALDPNLTRWKLNDKAVCHLFEIRKSCPMEYTFLDIAQAELAAYGHSAFSELTGGSKMATKKTVAGLHAFATSNAPFNKGFFMLRFAVETGVLHIGYSAPTSFAPCYEGDFTDITFASSGTQESRSSATFHVDIKPKGNAKDYKVLQAQFVVDAISKFSSVLKSINGQKGHRYEHDLVPDRPVGSGRPGLRRSARLTSDGAVLSERILMENFGVPPDVLVENLSDEPFPTNGTPCVYFPGCKCCMSPTGQTIYKVTEMVCKIYAI